MREWLASPRLNHNPLKGGYRNANQRVTLLDNHDLQQRIMSHARSKHNGDGVGLDWAIRVVKLCLGALFTMRGIPQLYYGTEIGMEGWKNGGDADLRRDFPWEIIGNNNKPKQQFRKQREIYSWTKDLIQLRKNNAALKYGTTLTLWSDDLVYAFLRISTDDIALVVINNGYESMQQPLRLKLNRTMLSQRAISKIKLELSHWKTGQALAIQNEEALVSVDGKSIDIYCS